MEKLKQCHLVQGNKHQYAWIAERGAKVGFSVELKDGSGFWKVKYVGPSSITRDTANKFRDAHRTQRQASDI